MKKESYLNKIIYFKKTAGCIPKESYCYCYKIEDNYFWVSFQKPILGRNDIKIHQKVIFENSVVID